MALTIAPAVSGTRKRFCVETVLFSTGVVVGASVSLVGSYLAVGLVEAAIGTHATALVAAGCICWAALRDLGIPVPVPYRKGQVPESLRDSLPREATAAVFGFLLGLGVATFFTYSAHAAMLLVLPFVQNGWLVLLCLLLFAAGKSMPMVASLGGRDTDEISDRFPWSIRRIRLMRLITACTAIATAFTLTTTL